MAVASVTYTNFINGTASDADQVDRNFLDLVNFLNLHVIHVDGTKSMTARLNLAALDPTTANHAARKSYVDSNHADVQHRVFAANNTFTNQAAYAVFPQAADRTALTLSFTKARADTILVLTMLGTGAMTSGVAQRLQLGIRMSGTASADIDIARYHTAVAAVVRVPFVAVADITGLAAGPYTFEPIFKATLGASVVTFFALDDQLSYSIHEIAV